jgi:hypothetical protein
MKTVLTAVTLAALSIAPTFIAPANADPISPWRDHSIRECVAMNNQYPHDPYDPRGGVQYMYQACMADHGEPG